MASLIFKQTNLLINNKDLYCEINNDVCFHGILAYNFTYNDFNQLLTNFLSINFPLLYFLLAQQSDLDNKTLRQLQRLQLLEKP